MFENLDIFKMSSAMAAHAGQKQAVSAQNVANADTPGYVARGLPDFKTTYASGPQTDIQRATRKAHLNGSMQEGGGAVAIIKAKSQSSPNGNQVSLETEMLESVDAKRQHDRALAIYKSALNILRVGLKT